MLGRRRRTTTTVWGKVKGNCVLNLARVPHLATVWLFPCASLYVFLALPSLPSCLMMAIMALMNPVGKSFKQGKVANMLLSKQKKQKMVANMHAARSSEHVIYSSYCSLTIARTRGAHWPCQTQTNAIIPLTTWTMSVTRFADRCILENPHICQKKKERERDE